jgi:hypothetical protein
MYRSTYFLSRHQLEVSDQLHAPAEKSPRYSLDMWLDWPQNRYGRREEEKNLSLTGIRTPTPRPSSPHKQSLYKLSYPGSHVTGVERDNSSGKSHSRNGNFTVQDYIYWSPDILLLNLSSGRREMRLNLSRKGHLYPR